MKTFPHRLSLLIALLFTANLAARTDDPSGVKFFTGSWKDVLAEAKRQNKPVFVDIYTTWCGPCKMMAKEAFPDPKVGEKFNASFVSYQIDAEKGEGIDLAKKYAVTAYPTSLYVSANGDLIYRTIGYSGVKSMLAEADKAIEAAKDPNPLSAMEKQYADGKRDTEFLAAYLQKRAAVGMPNGEALDVYLKNVPETEWSSDKNLKLISSNLTTTNSKGFDFLLGKLSDLRMSPSGRDIMMNLQNALQNDIKQAVAQKDEAQFETIIKRNQQLAGSFRPLSDEMKQQMATGYRMRFYQQTKNVEKYRALATVEANQLMNVPADSLRAKDERAYKRFQTQSAMVPDSIKSRNDFKKYAEAMKGAETKQVAMKLNNLAWAYYEIIDDKKDLNQALSWSARSLEYDRTGMYLDTYAHLLSKLGRKAEAIKTQEEAITKQRAAGEDATNYEKELAIMKAK